MSGNVLQSEFGSGSYIDQAQSSQLLNVYPEVIDG